MTKYAFSNYFWHTETFFKAAQFRSKQQTARFNNSYYEKDINEAFPYL
jgi:hypothetical protein